MIQSLEFLFVLPWVVGLVGGSRISFHGRPALCYHFKIFFLFFFLWFPFLFCWLPLTPLISLLIPFIFLFFFFLCVWLSKLDILPSSSILCVTIHATHHFPWSRVLLQWEQWTAIGQWARRDMTGYADYHVYFSCVMPGRSLGHSQASKKFKELWIALVL